MTTKVTGHSVQPYAVRLLTPSTTCIWVMEQDATPDPYAQETMCLAAHSHTSLCVSHHYSGPQQAVSFSFVVKCMEESE